VQYYWLNKQANKKLILFFAGWGFDENPFKFLDCGEYDVLMFYDYQNIESRLPDELSGYKEINLIAWSMGVFAAYLLFSRSEIKLNKKIAVNGTVYPVHDEFGIPVKIFELTRKHAAAGLREKFYKNVFEEDFERYMQNPVKRTIENRTAELESLYELIKQQPRPERAFYDRAVTGVNDKIIPAKNQLAFWQLPTVTLEAGHFPFYNYKSWSEILAHHNLYNPERPDCFRF
jgi:biotin synthesis protein BioG